MNAYLRNTDTNEYLKVTVCPRTKRVLRGLPKNWESKPPQIVRNPAGKTTVVSAGGDMPGWLFRLVRRGYGLTQVQLGNMMYKAHTTIHYYEQASEIPKVSRPLVYKTLQIDHRPDEMTPAVLKRIHQFLGITWTDLSDIIGEPVATLHAWAYGTRPVTDEGLNRLYALYCMLPSLSEGIPCLKV